MKLSLLRVGCDKQIVMAAIGMAIGLSACASSTIEDGMPRGASPGPRKSGEYPNINIERRAATTQMSDAERAAIVSELSARSAGAGDAGSNGAAEEARLRTLAEKHGESALKQIEDGE